MINLFIYLFFVLSLFQVIVTQKTKAGTIFGQLFQGNLQLKIYIYMFTDIFPRELQLKLFSDNFHGKLLLNYIFGQHAFGKLFFISFLNRYSEELKVNMTLFHYRVLTSSPSSSSFCVLPLFHEIAIYKAPVL